MKKKIYFITVSIIEIIVFLYIIFTANEIIQKEITNFESTSSVFSSEIQETVKESIETNGVKIIIFFSTIGIIFNIITINIALKNTILRNKGTLITFSVLHIVFGMSGINEILALITILILLCLKRVNPEDFPVKRELPKIEEDKLERRSIYYGIILIVFYFSQFIWKDYIPENKTVIIVVTTIFYLIVFALSIAFWNKKLLANTKIFMKNFITYFKFIIKKMLLMYGVYFVAAIVSTVITGEPSSVNQESLESMSKFVVIPLAIIWAPIVEETIFRGLIHKAIKNRYLFIITSSIVFGLLHTFGQEATVLNTIIKALPYAVLGGYLAYLYDKTQNITTSIFGHAFINTISSIITLL